MTFLVKNTKQAISRDSTPVLLSKCLEKTCNYKSRKATLQWKVALNLKKLLDKTNIMNLKSILRIFSVLLGLYILLLLATYSFQKQIIFRPQPLAATHIFKFSANFEEFELIAEDGHAINALYFKRKSPAKGLVLYFHGNADNLQRWGKYHEDFTARNYEVLMIDYRGYGKTKGPLSEVAMYQDAQLAYDWARKKYPAEEIIIYGRSLGTAVASNLARKNKAQRLVLETPFNHIEKLFCIQVPILWLPFPLNYAFPNDEHLQSIDYPVSIFQGTEDRLVPNRSTEQLRPFLKPGDQFYSVVGATHYNLSKFEDFQKQLDLILGTKK